MFGNTDWPLIFATFGPVLKSLLLPMGILFFAGLGMKVMRLIFQDLNERGFDTVITDHSQTLLKVLAWCKMIAARLWRDIPGRGNDK